MEDNLKGSGGKPIRYTLGKDDVDFGNMTPEQVQKLWDDAFPRLKESDVDVPIITGTSGSLIFAGTGDNVTIVSRVYPEKMYLVYYVVDGFINVNLFVTDNEFDAYHYVDKANGVLDRWKSYYLSLDGDHSNVLFDKVKLTNSIRGVYYKELEFRKF